MRTWRCRSTRRSLRTSSPMAPSRPPLRSRIRRLTRAPDRRSAGCRQRSRPGKERTMADKQSSNGHEHGRVAVRSWCPDCDQELGRQEFNRADLQQQQLSELPGREAMSLVNANIAIPVNLAAALNVLSDGSIAYAGAEQNAPIDQGT